VGFGRRREHEMCRTETQRRYEERSTWNSGSIYTRAARKRTGTDDLRSNGQEIIADVEAYRSRFPFCFSNKEMAELTDETRSCTAPTTKIMEVSGVVQQQAAGLLVTITLD
jgi:hypothetical protein